MVLYLTNTFSPLHLHFHPALLQPSLPSRSTLSLPLTPQPLSSLYSPQFPVRSLRSSKANSTQSSFCANSAREDSDSDSETLWEEPDEGSDSEFEEDEIGEEQEQEQEQDNRASQIHADGSSYEEDLLREVEQLLTPEEKAIFHMNKNPDLDKISTAKWNPLHSFALAMQIPLMDKLLENDVDINSVDKDGATPLHKAVMGKKEAVVSHLLRKNANPHIRDNDGATPLHYAVQVGALQTVKLLIKYKVDVNVADNEGWTPLHLAVQGRNRDITKVLLVNGADSTRRNQDGKTPLDISLCYGKDFKSYDLTRLLKLVPANRHP